MNIRERIVHTFGILLKERLIPVVLPAPHQKGSLAELQLERFNELYRFAFQQIPFYREKFTRAGLAVNSIKTIHDIERVPFLTKEEAFVLERSLGKRAFRISLESGGTTGSRLNTSLDRKYLIIRYKMLLRILYGIGWRLGEPLTALHPVEYAYWKQFFPLFSKRQFKKLIFDFIQQYFVYFCLHNRRNLYYSRAFFEGEPAGAALRALTSRRPRLLISRPDAAAALIRQASFENLTLPHIKDILLVGNLLAPGVKKDIGEAFHGSVWNMYASTELGYVGISCPESGIAVHVNEREYYLELNAEKEIVLTDFNNYAMPLIRYQTSDIGSIKEGDCSCGNSDRLLFVEGRKGKFIENDFREKFFDLQVIEYFSKFKKIKNVQIKKGPGNVIRLVLNPLSLDQRFLETIKDEFCEHFRFDTKKIVIDKQESVSTSSSGKLLSIV